MSRTAFLLFATQALFAINFIMSWWNGKPAGRNPWNDTGLEWDTPSPAPHGNFDHTPTVYHAPYEFSSPLVEEDFLMQTRKLPSSGQPASRPAGH
jgi:cytochrome c oxidase subunit 1